MLNGNIFVKLFSGLTMLGLLMAGPGAWGAPLHSVILGVPDHAEEALTWCGPATAQMIMEAYPSGACSELQEDIWTAIQTHKAETMWDSDPAGMRGAMKSLCPPVGSWSVHASTDPQSVMYDVARWMSKLNYPAAALLNTLSHNSYADHSEHWVAVRGVITDLDPRTNPVVNLLFVWFNDPAVPLGDPAMERFVSGSTWYSEFQPVTKPASSYSGKYVAVIEPPDARGRALAPAEILKGRLITPARAVEQALKWIEEYKLLEMGQFKMLKRGKPITPLLVNRESGGYYIVPFAEGGENRPAGGAVIINAYTGGFQEAGIFKPVRYMAEKEARSIALSRLNMRRPKNVSAELVIPMKERAVSRYLPLWKVTADGKTIGVSQRGETLAEIPR